MAAPMTRLTFGTAGDTGSLRCVNDHAHHVMVIRANDTLCGWCQECFDFAAPSPDVIASLAWYDDHENLSVLVDWLGDGSHLRGVIEKPWKWADEFAVAVAARDHECDTEHQVCKDGMRDDFGYCNDCGWTCTAGQVAWVCPFCETDCEDAADVERRAHLGCLADVAHDEQVAQVSS